jgi:hypothetical protein
VAAGLLFLGAGVLAVAVPAGGAPVPRPPGGDQIWFYNLAGGKLVAIDPTGRRLKTVEVKDGRDLRGISPPLNKLWFAGKDGRLPEPPPRPRPPGPRAPAGQLTLHVREINGKTEGRDLGVALTRLSHVCRDGKTVGRVLIQQSGTRTRPFVFENSLVDVASKRVTKLDLPGNHQFLGLAPDGTWVLTLEYMPAEREKGTPAYRLHRTPVGGGKPFLLSGGLSVFGGGRISPDGKRLLMFAQDLKEDPSRRDMAGYVVDVSTGKARRIAGHAKQLTSHGVWSPDGKRIAYAWRERSPDGQPLRSDGVPPTRLVVCDADGANARTILTTQELITLLGWW